MTGTLTGTQRGTQGGSPTRTAWRAYDGDALPPILAAARECFLEQGYHGTSIRVVAARAHLSVPGLYHHYRSKQALLVAIVRFAMEDLWARSGAALDEAGDDLDRRFDLLVECLLRFHANERALAFLAYSEIRSLADEERAEHIARRDRQQRLMDEVVAAGVAAGRFTAPHPLDASRAVVTMCTSVSQWFRIGGEMTPDELADRYRTIARMTVGAAVA
jgi:AcrR family transcriptional regulator